MKRLELQERVEEFVEQNKTECTEEYERIKSRVQSEGPHYHGEPVSFLYSGNFITKEELRRLEKNLSPFIGILKKVIERYEKDEAFRALFDFPKKLEELILLENPLSIAFPMLRLDCIVRSVEDFTIIELNTDGSSAMNEDRLLAEYLLDSLPIKELEKDYRISNFELFSSWIDTVRGEAIRLGIEKPTVLILDYYESEPEEFLHFKEHFEKKGMKTFIARPTEIDCIDGYVSFKGERIDMVYRRLVTTDLLRFYDKHPKLIEAIKAKKTIFVGPVKSQIIHNKRLFAVLSNEKVRESFTAEEKAFLDKHIPKTWVLTGDTLPLALEKREELILKPEDLYASRGVIAGKDVTPSEWKKALDEALSDRFLLQMEAAPQRMSYIDLDKGTKEMFRELLGIYYYGGVLQGFFMRVGRERIISGDHEGRTIPTLLGERR
ncbi:hypothetical protein [Guggenheimella bovis]